MKNVKPRLNKKEKYLLIINIFFAVLFIAYLLLPQVFDQDFWIVNVKGLAVPLLLIIVSLFIPYWLIRTRFYFLISLVCLLGFLFLIYQEFGWDRIQQASVNAILVTDAEEGFQKNYISQDISLSDHPRLLFTRDQEAILKKTIALNMDWNKINKAVLDASDAIVPQELYTYKRGSNILISIPKEESRRLLYLSYAYRITRQQKYLDAATNDLLIVASAKNWAPANYERTAEIMLGVAIAYDWLYDNLSTVDRLLIEKALITKGIQPSLDTYYTNWLNEPNELNQLANTAMLYSAIAIYDRDVKLARKIINRSIESLSLSMKMYAPNGVYSSGYFFDTYGTTYVAMAIDVLNNQFKSDFGLSQKPGFLKTGTFLQNLKGPAGLPFNYSDGDFIGKTEPNAALYWLAAKANDKSMLWGTNDILKRAQYKDLIKNRLLPVSLIWGTAAQTDKTVAPTNNMLVEKGAKAIALMRTSWTDPNAVFVGFKAGSPLNRYGHMDIGSFVLDAIGKRWVLDLGGDNSDLFQGKGFNIFDMSQNSKRWDIFRNNNKSHSTLTVNNDKQQVNAVADINRSSANADFMYAISNLSGTYNGSLNKAERGIAIAGQKVVQLRDEIETPNAETSVKWKVLTDAKIKLTSNTTAELSKDDKKYYVRVVEPLNIKLQTWAAEPSIFYETRNPGVTMLGFTINKTKAEKVAISVVFSDDNDKVLSVNKIAPLKDWR